MNIKNIIKKNLSILFFFVLAGVLSIPALVNNNDWGGWWSVLAIGLIGLIIFIAALKGKANT